ncbi:MAG: Ig-like domain-containing protein, partial [Nostocales cyanobacterium ELA608]
MIATETVKTSTAIASGTASYVDSGTGSYATDQITNATATTLTITAEHGATVAVFDNGVQIGTASETGTSGQFTYTASGLTDGAHSFTAQATDIAGNTSAVSSVIGAETVDTSADKGSEASLVQADVLVGNAEKGTVAFAVAGMDSDAQGVVTFTDGSGNHVDVQVSGNTTTGTVNLSTLVDGNITSSLAITDNAGNTITKAGSNFVLDTSADKGESLSISTVRGANVFADAVQVTLGGIDSDVNATAVTVRDAAGHSVAADVDGSGTWTANINGLDRGALTVTATVFDAAGNAAYVNKTVYSSISSAVSAAAAGSTVTIAQGTYSDDAFATLATPTSPREIIISKGLTIVGLGDGNSANGQEVIINSSTSRTFVISGDITGGSVSISGVKIVGGTEGVSIDGSGQDTDLGTLSVTNSTFVGQSNAGLVIGLNLPASSLSNLVVQGVTFDQSGSAGQATGTDGNNTHEGIMAFGFEGTATLTNVLVKGADAGVTTNASAYGIHISGATNAQLGSASFGANGPVLGNVTLNNVDVVGGFAKNAVAIYNYADITGLHGAAGSLDLTGATAGWGSVLNVDGIATSYDASTWGVALGGKTASLQGEAYDGSTPLQTNFATTITGTSGSDILIGKAGDDHLIGGSGVDTVVVTATSAAGVTFGRDANTGEVTVTTAYTGKDTLNGVEFVQATDFTGVNVVKTFVIVDQFADVTAAIAAAPNGSVLVKANTSANPFDVSLTDASAALAKNLSFYGADTVTVHASAADLLAQGSALGSMHTKGVDQFITSDVVSPAQYSDLMAQSGSSV